jgi:DNA-binding beta-propeller fold protein YncE
VAGAGLLAVSSTGELAVSLGYRNTIGFESTGTLARMPLGSAAPREVLEGVEHADWAPDGGELAVARDVDGRRRLEYPIGTVLHETGGWISHVRVSPDGRRVAFVDHANRGDNRGVLAVATEGSEVGVLADRAPNGIAWAPSGKEIFVAAGGTLSAVDLSGRARVVHRELSTFQLHDASADGHVLLSRSTDKREMVAREASGTEEKNLSWFDWTFPTLISPDGQTVVFEEQNLVTESGNYALFMRPTNGSPPVRLGEGRAFDMLPDGRIFGVMGVGASNEVALVPTGAGEVQRFGPLGLTPTAAAVGPDGDTLVFAGHARGEGSRLYVRGLAGGEPRPISPEGITAYFCRLLSPSGKEAFANAPDGRLTVYPVDGGDARPVPGTSAADAPIGWTRDGRGIFVQTRSALPSRIERIDVATGDRALVRELTPPDPAGVVAIRPVHLAADGEAYVYSYKRLLDELYVLEGLK